MVTQVAIRTTEVGSVVRFAVPPEVTAAYFDSAVLAIHHGKTIDHCKVEVHLSRIGEREEKQGEARSERHCRGSGLRFSWSENK